METGQRQTKSEIKTFEDLEVWQVSRNLRKKIVALTRDFPVEEKWDLVHQMRRAARSVTANIAEGYGRFHYQENIQFCRQSRGSLYELLDHLISSKDDGYVSGAQLEELRADVFTAIRLLNGYLRMLHKMKVASIDG